MALVEERSSAEIVIVLCEFFLRLWVDVEALHLLVAHVVEEVACPLCLDLDRRRSIAVCRWSVRPVEEEHVGEAGRRKAQERVATVLPLLGQRVALLSAQVYLTEATGVSVEARGKNDGVKLLFLAVLHLDTLLSEALDGLLLDGDNVDVGLVENVVVVLLQRWSHRAECVGPLPDVEVPESANE